MPALFFPNGEVVHETASPFSFNAPPGGLRPGLQAASRLLCGVALGAPIEQSPEKTGIRQDAHQRAFLVVIFRDHGGGLADLRTESTCGVGDEDVHGLLAGGQVVEQLMLELVETLAGPG